MPPRGFEEDTTEPRPDGTVGGRSFPPDATDGALSGNPTKAPSADRSSRRGRPSAASTIARRAMVIDAARNEFLARGYRDATMERIAREAGVAKRSLYLWHKDKAALFEACIVDGTADLNLPRLEPSLGVAFALDTYGRALLPALSSDYALSMTRLLFREAPEFEVVRGALDLGSGLVAEPVARLLEGSGFDRGDAVLLAESFIVMLLAGIQRAAIAGTAAPTEAESMRHLSHVTRLFVAGLEGWRA